MGSAVTAGNDTELDGDESAAETANFSATVLDALSRTPRFDLSIRGLVADERLACSDLLTKIENLGQRRSFHKAAYSSAHIQSLRQAFAPPLPPTQAEYDSDDALGENQSTSVA